AAASDVLTRRGHRWLPESSSARLAQALSSQCTEIKSLHCLSAFNPAIGKVRRLYNPRQPTSRSRTLGIGQSGRSRNRSSSVVSVQPLHLTRPTVSAHSPTF